VTSIVLDASVAAKWMLPAKNEPFRTEAYRLLDDFAAGTLDLLVPDVFWAECGNIVWKAVRQQRFSRADGAAAISSMINRKIPTVSSVTLMTEALNIAFDNDRAVYDCLYVALALESKRSLITADERLANALAARYPVKWLGAV
jgi:predicted nucleic acid-binding protein